MRPTLQAQRLIDAIKATGLLKRSDYSVTTLTKRYGPGGHDREYGHAYATLYCSAELAQKVADAVEGMPGVKVQRKCGDFVWEWPRITSG